MPGFGWVDHADYPEWPWRGLRLNGDLTNGYITVPNVTNYTVLDPDGQTPTEASLATHRYRHHVAVGLTADKVWVAFSSSGTNEDAAGQMVAGASMDKIGSSFAAPVSLLPPQSAWSGTGTYTAGTRIAMPRCFVTSGGSLYLVSAVEDINADRKREGAALIATECKNDGTAGTPVRISAAAYTAANGVSTINYDGTLAAAIYAEAKLYGVWGGSDVGVANQSDWIGNISEGGFTFTEPVTVRIDANDANDLYQLWRKTSGDTSRWWGRRSLDGGVTWSTLAETLFPNAPSAGCGLRLSDGRVVFVFNPRNRTSGGSTRDPLLMAVFTSTMQPRRLYAVRTGLTPSPTYAGINKDGGAAYPGIAADATNIWVGYSIHKESIGCSKILLASL